MRLQDRPRWRGVGVGRFADYEDGVAAGARVAQSGLYPTNCRLLDPGEAADQRRRRTTGRLLVLGFESADHPLDAWMERAAGAAPRPRRRGARAGATRRGRRVRRRRRRRPWRSAFLRMPYRRDALAARGVIVETFETACTWDRFAGSTRSRRGRGRRRDARRSGAAGVVTCRFTHVYPDGPAPYLRCLRRRPAGAGASSSGTRSRPRSSEAHPRRGRHDHPPPRRRSRPPALVRPAAPGPVRRRPRGPAKAALDPPAILNPGA